MNQRIGRFLWMIWYGLVALLTLIVAAVSFLRLFTTSLEVPQFILENAFADPFLAIHVGGSIVALILGPFQFVPRIRAEMPAVHRAIGQTYIGACAIGALAGLPLAIAATTGPIAGTGFAIAALLWLIFTYHGLRAAIDGRFPEHREWMIRSYAMTFNGITLRLLIPLALVLNLEFVPAYIVIAWLTWIINLAAFETYIRRTRAPTTTEGRHATARMQL